MTKLMAIISFLLITNPATSGASAEWKNNPHLELINNYLKISNKINYLGESVSNNGFDSYYDFKRYNSIMSDISDLAYETLDLIEVTETMLEEYEEVLTDCDLDIFDEDRRTISIIKSEVRTISHLLPKTMKYIGSAKARAFTAYKQQNRRFANDVSNEIVEYINLAISSHFRNYDQLSNTSVREAFNHNISEYILNLKKKCN